MRVYKPYWEWEDWINGMWRKVDDEEYWLKRAIEFTSDWQLYGSWMIEVVEKWPNTMLHNLTNSSINKRAFVGHCACSLAFNCPEYIVRMAWKNLTDLQRMMADKIAQETVNKWIERYKDTLKHGRKDATLMEYRMMCQ